MAVLLALCVPVAALAGDPIDFATQIRPILAQNCYDCHGPDDAGGGLQLSHSASVFGQRPSGRTTVVPGDPDGSELMRRVTHRDPARRMPPRAEPLGDDQVQLLRRWIEQGADWDYTHWAFAELDEPTVPRVDDGSWPRNEIDRFVLAQLEAHGIRPSPAADRRTLIRRLCVDLLGLLPAPEAVDAFVADARPDAWERLVDDVLGSPHFGERWGRHWLDKARYADSDGYLNDNERPDAWRYRDWVIQAINDDMPFDQFTLLQLAGDLVEDAGPLERLATAFHRQTLTNREAGVDTERYRVAEVFDRVETTSQVWLGLTANCARCHDHKYDDFSQAEYYQLFAFFNNAEDATARVPGNPAQMRAYQLAEERHEQQLAELREMKRERRQELEDEAALAAWAADLHARIERGAAGYVTRPQVPELSEEAREALANSPSRRNKAAREELLAVRGEQDSELRDLDGRITALQDDGPERPTVNARVLRERREPRETHIMHMGEYEMAGDQVYPGVPRVLHEMTAAGDRATRLDLARWLIDDSNALTPRVTANHIWLRLFGEGLVRTPEDFGVRGELPTHPELLDWLAYRYRHAGWSRKAMIRLIVNSATYRMASDHRSDLVPIDPNNRLLYRQNRFRVEAEIVRDLSLDASGLLIREIGGRSVFPPMQEDPTRARGYRWDTETDEQRYRRGMYTFFKRTAPFPNLVTFDCPDSTSSVVQRQRSNTPLQALTTLNNEVFVEASRAFARRLRESGHDDVKRLQHGFRLATARQADTAELESLKHLLRDSRQWYAGDGGEAARMIEGFASPGEDPAEQAAWVVVASTLLNIDEFLMRE